MVFRRVCRHLSCVVFSLFFSALTTLPLLADEPAPAAAAVPPAAGAEPARFEPAAVAAKGRAQSLLRVSRPGRYALRAKSETGTAIQLVDRLAGPGTPAGVAGEQDGRLDVYLEPGEYLLRTSGPAGAKGEAKLEVTPFHALVEGELQLPELREIEAELGDLEERSYWFELAEAKNFVFEAAGRHLADVSLWRDGGWLVDAPAKVSEIEPRPGRPLRLHQLAVRLGPGLYRLSLAGGPSLPWADDDGTHPVVFRRGLQVAGEAGRSRQTLGLFGFVRYVLPKTTTFVRLELPAQGLPAGKSLAIDWVDYDEANPFPETSGWLELTKESEPPYLEGYLDAGDGEGERLFTITGATGETFVFQHFNNERVRTFNRNGDYWLSTLAAGDAADRLDATAVLTRRERGWTSNEVPLKALAADVVQLGPGTERRRQVSITGTSELFFYVTKLGEYEFTMPKTALRVLPLAPTWQYSAASPPFGNLRANVPFKEGTGRWKLDPGYYVLQLEPREQDVVELMIRALDGTGKQPPVTAPHGVASFASQALETRYDYTVFLNAEPGVEAGLVLRESPVDPRRPLPLEAGQTPVAVPVTLKERGVLRVVAEDPAIPLALTVDGTVVPASTWLDAGDYQVTVARGDAEERPVAASLYFEPGDRVAEEPLPALPADALAKLPIYPQLDDQGERHFDLDRGGVRTFLVHAEEPALYRLESTGLLDTEGSLRTSLRPRIDAAQDGGSGRNFLLQQFLRPGDYQLSVKALGKSAGHLGVRLARSPVRDGGLLPPGVSARADLPAGEAVAYRLQVPAAGKYRVRALGLGRPFRIRLDDAAGWPLPAPGSPGDLNLDLEKGEYRLIVLPQAVDGRVIARFDLLPADETQRQGHGPFPLPFGISVGNRWLEPAEGQERQPDVWTFTLPAPAGLSLALDAEMQAELWRAGAKVADVPPARTFHQDLAAGDFQLRVFCSRRNNRVDYHLRAELDQLIAGQSRRIEVPATVEVSLAGEGLAEISSFGQVDVRARLYDPAGREVARFDDRPGDWNFAYTGRLAAGTYRLQVDPVSAGGPTEVQLRLPSEKLSPTVGLPLARKLKLESGVEVFPLELPGGSEVLALAASAPGSVRIALEASAARGREGNGKFQEVASREGAAPRLLVWLSPGTSYRLRVESLAHGENEVSLQGAALPLGALSEKALAAGVKPKAVAGLPADFGILAASFERPGCFTVAGGAPALAAGLAGRAAAPLVKGQTVLGAPAGKLLLAADPRSAVRLQRWQLPEGESTFFLPAEGIAECDLAAAKGDGLRFVRASALAGQPSLAPAKEPGAVQAVAAGSASTLVSAAGGSVILRGEGGAPLRLASRAFKAAAEQALGAAGGEGEVPAGGSVSLKLPAGVKELRLLIDQGLVASLEGGGEIRRIYSAEEGAVDVSVAGAFHRLQLVLPAATPARWSLALAPAGAGAPQVAVGEPFERRLARAGQIEIALVGASEVHVRGARGSLLLGADGKIARGSDLAMPAGAGRLLIDGEPGLLWVWLDDGGGTLAGLWPAGQLGAGKKVALPALEELGAGIAVYDFDFPAPTLLHLRGDVPGVVAAELAPGAPLQVSAHAAAISADVYLPQGRGRVALRAAGGAGGGIVELRSSPVEKAGEGLGPSFLLGPGQSRYLGFTVPAAGQVGWAARAESGVVDGRLLDASGHELARGGAGFRELAAGDYLLGLAVPAAARPTRVRAALVGLVPRNDLPPQELIAQYAAGTVPLPGELAAQAEAQREAAEEEARRAAEAAESGGDGQKGDQPAGSEVSSNEEGCEGEDCSEACEGDGCGEEGGGEESGGEEGGGR